MKLAINSDYCGGVGNPVPRLKAIAEAGFTHIHWCHQWNTDFFYTAPELRAIKQAFQNFGLTLLDIHGSDGQEKCWYSTDETVRQAGVLLVRNRMEMFAELGGIGSLMMHIPAWRSNWTAEQVAQNQVEARTEALYRSLEELFPYCEKYNCPIAVENHASDTFEAINRLMKKYDTKWLGITYDSGHGNIREGRGLELLEPVKDRLMALHLNDNDHSGDLHQPAFYGNVDWQKVAELIDASGYQREMLSFELSMRYTPFMNQDLHIVDQTLEAQQAFLKDAYERGCKVARLTKRFC
jgi:sugar phosphate isomerase/epimerase